jgi:hypothetical protein
VPVGHLGELQRELDVNYCHLAVISTDAPGITAAFRAGLGATYTFLSDHDRRAVTELDIVDTTDDIPGSPTRTASRRDRISGFTRSTTGAGLSGDRRSRSSVTISAP